MHTAAYILRFFLRGANPCHSIRPPPPPLSPSFLTYQHFHSLAGEVQRDGAAQLGGGAREEHLLHARLELVHHHRGGERVAVADAHLELRVALHKEEATAVQGLVLGVKRGRGKEERGR